MPFNLTKIVLNTKLSFIKFIIYNDTFFIVRQAATV